MNKLIAHALLSAPLLLVWLGNPVESGVDPRTDPPSSDPARSRQFDGMDAVELLMQTEKVSVHVIQSATGHLLVQTDRESGEMEILLNLTTRPQIPRPVRVTFSLDMLLGVVVDGEKLHVLFARSRAHDSISWSAVPRTTERDERLGQPRVELFTYGERDDSRLGVASFKRRPLDAGTQDLVRIALGGDRRGVLELRDGELFAFGEPVSGWR